MRRSLSEIFFKPRQKSSNKKTSNIVLYESHFIKWMIFFSFYLNVFDVKIRKKPSSFFFFALSQINPLSILFQWWMGIYLIFHTNNFQTELYIKQNKSKITFLNLIQMQWEWNHGDGGDFKNMKKIVFFFLKKSRFLLTWCCGKIRV